MSLGHRSIIVPCAFIRKVIWKVVGWLCIGGALIAHNANAQTVEPRKPQAAASAHHRSTAAAGPLYGAREDVVAFAHRTAALNDLDARWVRKQLAAARRLPVVQKLIMPPPSGTAKNWGAYRDRFLTPDRVGSGVAFWQRHERWLQAAEARWGVPAEVIVGIVGVETFYGRIMGTFRVLDALSTLSFDFPSGRSDRSEFFREQLSEFLVLASRQKTDPARWRGSYAGAMGLPQFMPGNVNRLAVDFDEDGRIDLYDSPADVIGSVAHFLADAGWVADMPARFELSLPADGMDRSALLAPDIWPSFTASQLADRGVKLDAKATTHEGLLALVELQMGEAPPVYVAGTRNFWVLSRYNRSSYYVMAVLSLGEEVRRRRLQADRAGDGSAADGASTAAVPAARTGPAARCKPRTGRCERV